MLLTTLVFSKNAAGLSWCWVWFPAWSGFLKHDKKLCQHEENHIWTPMVRSWITSNHSGWGIKTEKVLGRPSPRSWSTRHFNNPTTRQRWSLTSANSQLSKHWRQWAPLKCEVSWLELGRELIVHSPVRQSPAPAQEWGAATSVLWRHAPSGGHIGGELLLSVKEPIGSFWDAVRLAWKTDENRYRLQGAVTLSRDQIRTVCRSLQSVQEVTETLTPPFDFIFIYSSVISDPY